MENNQNPIAIHFYKSETNEYIGQGFYMPSYDFFHNTYIPEHYPNAKRTGKNRDEHTNGQGETIAIECENADIRQPKQTA
jgi:hypothetical protein